MNSNQTLNESEVADAFAHYRALSETELYRQVLPAFSMVLYEGGLSGETEASALERFYNERFIPSLQAAIRRNDQAAKDILAALDKNQADVTAVVAGLVTQYLVDTMQLPEPNERKLIVGFAVTLIYVAMKAKGKGS